MSYQDGLGFLVANCQRADTAPAVLAPKLRVCRASWVAVKIAHALQPGDDGGSTAQQLAAWMGDLRGRVPGLTVFTWSVPDHDPASSGSAGQVDPRGHADLVYKQWQTIRQSAHMYDCEGDYCWNAGDATDQATVQGRNKVLVDRHVAHFAGQVSRGGLWLTPLGNPEKGYDYTPWLRAGAYVAPQFYPGVDGSYIPGRPSPGGVSGYLDVGFPLSKIKPMIWAGDRRPSGQSPWPIAENFEYLRGVDERFATTGLAVFLAESMTDSDWAALELAMGHRLAEAA